MTLQGPSAATPTLPAPGRDPAAPGPLPSPASRQAGLRIWILEDDPKLCDLLAGRFGALGWRSVAFGDHRALEQALQQASPDLLVLDEMLPGRSGTEVLAGLRQWGHAFPVLMLSAMRAPGDRIAGLEAGADDYMGKPFEFRELQLRIERLMATHASRSGFHPAPRGSFQIGSLLFHAERAELVDSTGAVCRISRGDAALLQALCSRPGEVIGRQALALASGSLVDPSQSRTIDVRLGRLRRLLNGLLPEAGEVIEACRGQGYRIRVPIVVVHTP